MREPGALDVDHPDHVAWVERYGWCALEGPGEHLCSVHPRHRYWFDSDRLQWFCFRYLCHDRSHSRGDPTTAPFPMTIEDLG